MTAKAKASAAKPPEAKTAVFEDEKRYRVEVSAAAIYGDARLLPGRSYVVKGKVAKEIATAVSRHDPV